jgi:hypothetical protein
MVIMKSITTLGLAIALFCWPAHAVHFLDIELTPIERVWYQGVVRSDTAAEDSPCRDLLWNANCHKPPGAGPGGPGSSCCGVADAYYADAVRIDGDKVYAIITDDRIIEGRYTVPIGTEILIPRKTLDIYRQGNPTGHVIVFLLVDGTFPVCYFTGTAI